VVYLFGAAVTPLAGRCVDLYGHRTGLAIGMGVGSVGAALTLTQSGANPLRWRVQVNSSAVFAVASRYSGFMADLRTNDSCP